MAPSCSILRFQATTAMRSTLRNAAVKCLDLREVLCALTFQPNSVTAQLCLFTSSARIVLPMVAENCLIGRAWAETADPAAGQASGPRERADPSRQAAGIVSRS